MPSPPLHKSCGTAHWSTQPCPLARTRPEKLAELKQRKAAQRVKTTGKAVKRAEGLPPTTRPDKPPPPPPSKKCRAPRAKASPLDPPAGDPSWRSRALKAEAALAARRKKESERVKRYRDNQKKEANHG